MIRYSFFVLAVIATAATAIAAVRPATETAGERSMHVTVIHKNQAFPVMGPLVIEPCATEDCSDVQS
ncbi:MAG: hypothetical protein ACREDX_08170 [Aestuariivirga sp.]